MVLTLRDGDRFPRIEQAIAIRIAAEVVIFLRAASSPLTNMQLSRHRGVLSHRL